MRKIFIIIIVLACLMTGCASPSNNPETTGPETTVTETTGPETTVTETTAPETTASSTQPIEDEENFPPPMPLVVHFSGRKEYYAFADAINGLDDEAFLDLLMKNNFHANGVTNKSDARDLVNRLSVVPFPDIPFFEPEVISVYHEIEHNEIRNFYNINGDNCYIEWSMDPDSAALSDYSGMTLLQTYTDGELFYYKTVDNGKSAPTQYYKGHIYGHSFLIRIRSADKTSVDNIMKTISWKILGK